jgi:hypothetical protein
MAHFPEIMFVCFVILKTGTTNTNLRVGLGVRRVWRGVEGRGNRTKVPSPLHESLFLPQKEMGNSREMPPLGNQN